MNGPRLVAPVIYLSGRATLPLLVISLSSLYAHVSPQDVTVLSDGSLTPNDVAALQSRFPNLRCVTDMSLHTIDAALPRRQFPSLRRLRDTFLLARKLLDIHFLGRNRFIFVDADTVFLKTPDEIIARDQRRTAPWHLVDPWHEYGMPPEQVWEAAGMVHSAPINTGLFSLGSQEMPWDFVEEVATKLLPAGHHNHHSEQAIYAAVLTRMGAEPLPAAEYISFPSHADVDQGRGAFHHYVAPARYLLYADTWRKYLN